MTRGLLLSLTPAEVVARALSLCVVPDDPAARIMYSSARGRNGGGDPDALTCASLWRDGNRGPVRATADCVGFAAWAAGFDRYQPARATSYGGWLNQASMIMEAARPGGMFVELDEPVLGCIGAIDNEGKRVGHVGIVVGFKDGVPQVAHCSPSNERRVGQAIAVTSARVAFGSRQIHWLAIAPWVTPDRDPARASVGPPEGPAVA